MDNLIYRNVIMEYHSATDQSPFLILQADARAGWAQLPHELLEKIAGGRNEMKVMRLLSKSWWAGFEKSVTSLNIKSMAGPSNGFADRFPNLVSLDLGESFMKEGELSKLSGLDSLRNLTLGLPPGTRLPRAGPQPLAATLTGAGLKLIQQLPLTRLNLAGCLQLKDDCLENLRGMPLASLDLAGCAGLTTCCLQLLQGMWDITDLSLRGLRHHPNGGNLQYLHMLRLASVDVFGCQWITLRDLGALRAHPLTTLDLGNCTSLSGRDLEHLSNVSGLQKLGLSGTNISTAGLKRIATLRQLTSLDLSRTATSSE